MQRKNWVSFGFIAAFLIASLLMLNASTPAPTTKPAETTCCKKAAKDCPAELKTNAPASAIPENLSHQFISLPSLMY